MLVTGGNSGIGYEVCRKLAENNAQVSAERVVSSPGGSARSHLQEEHSCTFMPLQVFLVTRLLSNGEEAASRIRAQVCGVHARRRAPRGARSVTCLTSRCTPTASW